MIVWLEKALVLAIHDRQVAEHGGSAGMRDDGLLESALARPQQLHAYGDPAPDLAAALAYGLARNHPFVDGNKRTAAGDLELFQQYLALAEGKLAERDFSAWLRERLRLAPGGGAHEPRKPYRAKPRGTRRAGARARPGR
jgi:death-on-curing protein